MVALPDFDRKFDSPPLRADSAAKVPQEAGRALIRMVLRILGVAIATASIGLWVLPSAVADPAMLMFKLLFSLILFWCGMLCLHTARRPDPRPEVQIDRRSGQLRVIHPKTGRTPGQLDIHRLDDLVELSLRDGLLTARDRAGLILVSCELADRRSERALREALSLAA